MRHLQAIRPTDQRGIALLTALVLMLAVLLTGIAATRGAMQGARAAAHERDRVLAVQMADAALLDAERDIEGGAAPGSARAHAIAAGSSDAFVPGCRAGRPYDGLCAHDPDPEREAALLAEADGPAVVYGSHTGGVMPAGGGLPRAPPRYLVALLPDAPDGSRLYRVSARGAGSLPGVHAALEAYYRKPADGGPGRRIGWRELGNWSERHGGADAHAAADPAAGAAVRGRD